MSAVTIRRATRSEQDIASVAALFDAYRQFYAQPADLARARTFIGERLTRGESTIVIAEMTADAKTTAVGFVQLYATFSSISMIPVWNLNDLYVVPEHRRLGSARALMVAVHEMAIGAGIKRIVLETAPTNEGARRLYESLGYHTEAPKFLTYSFEVA